MNGKKTVLNRRKFLSASAMSMFGYSLMVSLPANARAASAAVKTPLGKRIDGAIEGKKISAGSEPNMTLRQLDCDVLVCGGGMAGISAALAAARNGAKTILVQDRSRLGGNASSEIKMHPLGMASTKYGYRESGIIEEIFLENAAHNPQKSWEVWDLSLYDKCVSEPNLTLILDTSVYLAETKDGKILCAYARSDKTLQIYKIAAKTYIDCTGDSRLAMEAGAELMRGRDGSQKYGENEVVAAYPVGGLLCSSIMYTTRDMGKPMPFKAPTWAKKITAEDLKFRDPRKTGFGYGYWFISHGGLADTIRDNEVIRFELLAVVLGVWDYIKNSGKFPEAQNLAMDTIGMIPGKRDSYRIVGKKLFTQHDIRGKWKEQPDGVGLVGWVLEDQPSEGFYATNMNPAMPHKETLPFNIPLSILISQNLSNMMMAGRNMSCSHLAFSCTRVMNTGSVAGQAAGTAAAIVARKGSDITALSDNPEFIRELQQNLLKDGQLILNAKNEDPADIALKATASASASDNGTKPENVLSGITFDEKGKSDNKWMADISKTPWLQLSWKNPKKISTVILNFDTGFRHLTFTLEESRAARILHAPQPETLSDFNLTAILPNGSERILAKVRGNYQKRAVIKFDPVEAKDLRVDCLKTQGDNFARLFEIRCYA